jgi:hypothetical protein
VGGDGGVIENFNSPVSNRSVFYSEAGVGLLKEKPRQIADFLKKLKKLRSMF